MLRFRRYWLLLAALLLTACGGGGGGDATSATPSVTSTDARAAWRSLLSATRVFSASGTGSDNANYQIAITAQPVGATTINSTQVQQIDFSTILNRNSASYGSSSFDLFILNGTGIAYAYREANGDCSLFSAASEPQATPAVIGQSGTLYSGTVAVGCSTINGVPVVTSGTITGTWSIQSEGAVTFFCVDSKRQEFVTTNQISCVEVSNAAGALATRVRISLVEDGVTTLVLRNY